MSRVYTPCIINSCLLQIWSTYFTASSWLSGGTIFFQLLHRPIWSWCFFTPRHLSLSLSLSLSLTRTHTAHAHLQCEESNGKSFRWERYGQRATVWHLQDQGWLQNLAFHHRYLSTTTNFFRTMHKRMQTQHNNHASI